MKIVRFKIYMVILSLLACGYMSLSEAGSVTKLEQTGGKFSLTYNGKPYFIKGAGGKNHLKYLKECGGNSIRTWGSSNLEELLDEAQSLGLTVTIGFWVGHERHGFDYNNEQAVKDQLERFKGDVQKYKDHPALLMRAIGNEMEGGGDNVKIWTAINEMAKACKEIDPNHPTMTVVAELGGNKIPLFNALCPDVDVLGINSYGGGPSAGERYQKLGGTKPYVITEFGPPGQWETGKTEWGAPYEMNSTEKGKFYYKTYEGSIENKPLCLGSYAFVWGFKQEATATWYGMFVKDGSKTPAVDYMTKAWSGKDPENFCPVIESFEVPKVSGIKVGDTVEAKIMVKDPEGQPLTYKWVLMQESGNYATGGDPQADQPMFPNAIIENGKSTVKVKIPDSGGSYRLYVFIYDSENGSAMANMPIKVDGEVKAMKKQQQKMPFYVYSDAGKDSPYFPSGYMGNTAAIKIDEACKDNPQKGNTCLKISYNALDNWGGVVWQSPPNDWGDQDGGFNLDGATDLEFWARGENGGEKLSFSFGLLKDKKFSDSAGGEIKDVILKKEWTKYRIALDGRDLSCIKTGFAWTLAGQGKPITFYLDEINYK
jgi:hypothetical protein